MSAPPVRQHTDQGSHRKQQLLDAAARLFAERGYTATRVNGTVAQLAHFHRTGRVSLDVDELARFAGTWVARALAGQIPLSPTAVP